MMPLISKGTHVGISKSALHFTTNQKKKTFLAFFDRNFASESQSYKWLSGDIEPVLFWSLGGVVDFEFSIMISIFSLVCLSAVSLSHIFSYKNSDLNSDGNGLKFLLAKEVVAKWCDPFFSSFFWRLLALKVVSHLYPSSSKFFERGKIWMTMLEWASPWNACQIQPSFVYLIVSILRRAIQRVRFPPTTLAFRGSTNISGNDNWAKNSNRE